MLLEEARAEMEGTIEEIPAKLYSTIHSANGDNGAKIPIPHLSGMVGIVESCDRTITRIDAQAATEFEMAEIVLSLPIDAFSNASSAAGASVGSVSAISSGTIVVIGQPTVSSRGRVRRGLDCGVPVDSRASAIGVVVQKREQHPKRR